MKVPVRTCDVLVVGAGPAGCSAALGACEGGLDIVICEAKPVPGLPVRCAEHIPALLRGEVHLDPSAIVQAVRSMRTILPDGSFIENSAPGYIINRDLFDLGLGEECRKRGIELLTGSKVLSKEGADVVVGQKGRGTFVVRPRVIVGADGPFSRVGKWMNSVNLSPIPAIQARVPLAFPMDRTEVYFRKEFLGGYGWLFPKGKVANAGLGMRRSEGGPRLTRSLEMFLSLLSDLRRIEKKVLSYVLGWIPSRPLVRTVLDNMILAGDAAGQTHPITGAGVPQAVVCGRMAGQWAARAAADGDLDLLKGYEEEWKDLYWESLEKAYKKRMLLESSWDRLDEILPSCWVGFREYHRTYNG